MSKLPPSASKPAPSLPPYKTFGQNYVPSGTGYQPIGSSSAPDTAPMQDPEYLAFHQGLIAASGGELSGNTPEGFSPAVARKVKYPGGPFKGMTRAGAADASLAAWKAQGGASVPKQGQNSMPLPNWKMPPPVPKSIEDINRNVRIAAGGSNADAPTTASDVVGNVLAELRRPQTPSVITPQAINGATSRGGGVATFPSGTVVDQPGGAKQMSSQYGTGSSVQVPGGVRDFSKAHVFDNGKPVLTSAARAAGVTGYDAQGNAIRATPTPAPPAPAPVAAAPSAPAPQVTRQVMVPKAPAGAPAPTSWVDRQVAEIKKGTKVYDPNSAADRAAFAPRAYPAPKVPKPIVTPGQIDQARADLADSRPGWQKIQSGAEKFATNQLKTVISPYRLGAAAINGLGMGMVKGVGQGINWLFKGDTDKAAKATKTLKAAVQ